MEKILILNGSPRGLKGNTQILVNHFMEGYKSVRDHVQVKQVALTQMDIKPCTGCFGCWTKSPGACVLKDDMEVLFKDYIDADLVVWATPLYHYGMTSIMKKFVERTLPLSDPKIEKIGDKYTHPERFDLNQKHVLISNCGFPEMQNFNVITKSFERITGGPITSVLCVMGEILSQKPLRSRFNWYLDAVKNAGSEVATIKEISEETGEILGKCLLPVEEFVDMANISWDIKDDHANDPRGVEAVNGKKGFQFLKLMNYSFNPSAANDLEVVLEMEFTDTQEVCQFHIRDNTSRLIEGSDGVYTTKIITTYETWLDISEGRLDGAEAMLQGLYKVKGDLGFMMKLSQLYGEGVEEVHAPLENKKILGLARSKWMGITFIPWSLSWMFFGNNPLLGVWLPMLIMVGILLIKGREKAVTYFEQTSALYFMVVGIMTLLGVAIPSSQATLLNFFVLACIWGFSVVSGNALTSDYSLYDQEEDLRGNVIFDKTNDHLTLLWSGLFVMQGVFFYNLEAMNLNRFSPLLYVLLLAAGKFTQWYSRWYPEKIMRG